MAEVVVPKPWWASRTIWANLIGFVATMTIAFGIDLGLDAETQTALVGGVMAVINMILRFITKAPVTSGGQ